MSCIDPAGYPVRLQMAGMQPLPWGQLVARSASSLQRSNTAACQALRARLGRSPRAPA
jgi:hypothetical protein